jgi:hypothetical protein
MCSENELRKQLDKIPPRPYKPVADLKEIHRLFHEATKTDEGVPYSFDALSTRENILAFVGTLNKNTNLQQALELINTIQDEMVDSFYPEGSNLVLQLLHQIYISHNPPEKINHQL